jgi:hypothetical protein
MTLGDSLHIRKPNACTLIFGIGHEALEGQKKLVRVAHVKAYSGILDEVDRNAVPGSLADSRSEVGRAASSSATVL